MQKLESQKRLELAGWLAHAVGLTIGVVIVALAYVFLMRPIELECGAISEDVDAINQLIGRSEEIQGEHALVQKRFSETQQELEDLLVRIPDSPKDAEFLAEISRLAQREGMEILSFEPFTPTTQDKHHEMQINLTTQASYASICHVLSELGRSDRLCRVDRMSIESDAVSPLYTIKLSITIFFAPQAGISLVKR